MFALEQSMNCIELTEDEKALLDRIDFDPRSSEKHDVADWNAVGGAARWLMKSLIARKAIPEVRTKYFTDADFDVGGRGRSRADIFEKNGTHAFPRLTEPFNSRRKTRQNRLGALHQGR
jgi:hypothetical protein